LKVGEGDSYTIDHSSAIYMVDKEGDVRLRYPYGFKIEGIVEDIKKLIE
jgi:protein SCO1/2